MTLYDPNKHHRRSIRLKGYDYSQAGAYFVTVGTWQREGLFGEVVEGRMRLSGLGEVVREEWLRSAQMRQEIELYEDEFVIMPNHIHGIVWIVNVGAHRAPVQNSMVGEDGIRPDSGIEEGEGTGKGEGGRPGEGAHRAPLRREGRTLGSFVAGIKAAVTARARRELGIRNVWQRNYYEHIIRNEIELEKINYYIQTNPQRWESDKLHPSAPPNQFNQE